MAFLLATSHVTINGTVTAGKRIATVPYAHLQLDAWNCSESGEPPKAVMMKGEDVKAKARPLFCRDEVSDVKTSTQKIRPVNPTE
jgi:hypothetical protein